MKFENLLLFALFQISLGFSFQKKDSSDDICSGLSEGEYLVADPEDCHKFYSCVVDGFGHYVAEHFTCPATLAFDDSLKRCEKVESVASCKQEPTTTIIPPTGNNILLVAMGSYSEPSRQIEIINLHSPESVCEQIPDFPLPLGAVYGAVNLEGNPMICSDRDCLSLNQGKWEVAPSLNVARGSGADMVSSVQNSENGREKNVVIIGGMNQGFELSVESLRDDSWQVLNSSLRWGSTAHCLAYFEDLELPLRIAGMDNQQITSSVNYFDAQTQSWDSHSSLLYSRSAPFCSRIATSEGSTSRSVIVAGGYHRHLGPLSVVEILDPGTRTWRQGPRLPFPFWTSAMVQDSAGGVILVGGQAGEGKGPMDTLYRLAHGGDGAQWEELPFKLKSKRTDHLAMLLPSTMFNCSNTHN